LLGIVLLATCSSFFRAEEVIHTRTCPGTDCKEGCEKIKYKTLPTTDWRGERYEMTCEGGYEMSFPKESWKFGWNWP
ncbi:hypothetical protein PMAYCL1PPCAC_24688, partial [Pristionchus mayeri]